MAHVIVWHNKSNAIRYIKGTANNALGIATRKFSESDLKMYMQDKIFLCLKIQELSIIYLL